MTHLNSDELIDAIDLALAPDRQAHLAACERCRRELAQLSSVLVAAHQVSVPEPSPLFWQHFSERVRTSIDNATVDTEWPAWLRWQVLAPVGALALILLALTIAVLKQPSSDDALAALEVPDALDAPAVSDSWATLADLVGDLDLETATTAALVTTPGFVEQAVLDLTADERQELTRMLKAELTRAKS